MDIHLIGSDASLLQVAAIRDVPLHGCEFSHFLRVWLENNSAVSWVEKWRQVKTFELPRRVHRYVVKMCTLTMGVSEKNFTFFYFQGDEYILTTRKWGQVKIFSPKSGTGDFFFKLKLGW